MERWRENLFFLLLFFLPTQLGRHFWPEWTQVLGLRIDYFSPTLYLTDILIFFLFLFSLPMTLTAFKKGFTQSRFWLILAAFSLTILLLGIVRSKSPFVGVYQLVKGGEFGFLVFYLAQTARTFSQVQKMAIFLSLGVILESALSLGQFLNQGSLGGPFWFFGERTFSGQTPGIAQAILNGELILRPYGTLPHPNVLAGYLLVVLILISAIRPSQRWQEGLKWTASVLGSLTLFFTFSRLAWLVGFPVIFYLLSRERKWLLLVLLTFLMIGGAGLIQSRFQTLLTTDEESWQRREELNSAALAMIKAQPLFGVGLGNFLVELPHFHQDKGVVRFFQPAHNLYLMMGAELGMPMLIAFLGFLFLTYRRLVKQFKQCNNAVMKQFFLPLIIALSSILVLSFFDHYFYTLQQGQLLLALVLGLSWAKIKS